VEYDIEVFARSEALAEQEATTRANVKANLPADFRVAYDYITDTEIENTEQLTFVCERCEIEYPADVDTVKHPTALLPWDQDQDYCAPCGEKIEAEEKAVMEGKAAMDAKPKNCKPCSGTGRFTEAGITRSCNACYGTGHDEDEAYYSSLKEQEA
jgi:hypothetical protein